MLFRRTRPFWGGCLTGPIAEFVVDVDARQPVIEHRLVLLFLLVGVGDAEQAPTVVLLACAFDPDEMSVDQIVDSGGEQFVEVGRVERLEFDLDKPTMTGGEAGRAGVARLARHRWQAVLVDLLLGECDASEIEARVLLEGAGISSPDGS